MPKLITSHVSQDPGVVTDATGADQRRHLLTVFSAALDAVGGRHLVAEHLASVAAPQQAILIAVGKAAGAMAQGALDAWGPAIQGGLVISKPGHLDCFALASQGLDSIEGSHPVPGPGSLRAGERLLGLLGGLPRGAEILFLISGGASSLVEVPAGGLGLEELARANRWLLGSGLDIGRMNRVRKALSRIKAGGLLGWLGGRKARVLLISDVPGDDPAVIGSGLLVPDPALSAVAGLDLPPWLAQAVRVGLAERAGRPRPEAPPLRILAGLDHAKQAAAEAGRQIGYTVQIHSEFLDGEAGETGQRLAGVLASSEPGLHLWGGETTVRLPPDPGRGGRNQHLALAAALEIRGRDDLLLLAAGTDGTDGPTEDAGALVDGATLDRAAVEGLDGEGCLARADAGTLLEAAGDLIRTGPTGTNVMDLVLGLRLG